MILGQEGPKVGGREGSLGLKSGCTGFLCKQVSSSGVPTAIWTSFNLFINKKQYILKKVPGFSGTLNIHHGPKEAPSSAEAAHTTHAERDTFN